MDSAELADFERESHWNYETRMPLVPPDTPREAEIIALIDNMRVTEDRMRDHPDMGSGSFYRRSANKNELGRRRKSAERYWGRSFLR